MPPPYHKATENDVEKIFYVFERVKAYTLIPPAVLNELLKAGFVRPPELPTGTEAYDIAQYEVGTELLDGTFKHFAWPEYDPKTDTVSDVGPLSVNSVMPYQLLFSNNSTKKWLRNPTFVQLGANRFGSFVLISAIYQSNPDTSGERNRMIIFFQMTRYGCEMHIIFNFRRSSIPVKPHYNSPYISDTLMALGQVVDVTITWTYHHGVDSNPSLTPPNDDAPAEARTAFEEATRLIEQNFPKKPSTGVLVAALGIELGGAESLLLNASIDVLNSMVTWLPECEIHITHMKTGDVSIGNAEALRTATYGGGNGVHDVIHDIAMGDDDDDHE
jgi:hypothetical protein